MAYDNLSNRELIRETRGLINVSENALGRALARLDEYDRRVENATEDDPPVDEPAPPAPEPEPEPPEPEPEPPTDAVPEPYIISTLSGGRVSEKPEGWDAERMAEMQRMM